MARIRLLTSKPDHNYTCIMDQVLSIVTSGGSGLNYTGSLYQSLERPSAYENTP
jgi:hypothetical protein